MMPRQPDMRLRGADGLREDAIRVGAERLIDDVQRRLVVVFFDPNAPRRRRQPGAVTMRWDFNYGVGQLGPL
jgi:hypothetical protein